MGKNSSSSSLQSDLNRSQCSHLNNDNNMPSPPLSAKIITSLQTTTVTITPHGGTHLHSDVSANGLSICHLESGCLDSLEL
mmetsp:Transcript_29368/g.44418  ORF Transcript_29368/g.44418 Transcript_29368/m.44418 type:complete len:81 (-) Transcript_29368:917-1159(-)